MTTQKSVIGHLNTRNGVACFDEHCTTRLADKGSVVQLVGRVELVQHIRVLKGFFKHVKAQLLVPFQGFSYGTVTPDHCVVFINSAHRTVVIMVHLKTSQSLTLAVLLASRNGSHIVKG